MIQLLLLLLRKTILTTIMNFAIKIVLALSEIFSFYQKNSNIIYLKLLHLFLNLSIVSMY